jgi:thiol-disulfide isomerase/thioredoxin
VKSRTHRQKGERVTSRPKKNQEEKPPFPFAPVIVLGIVIALIVVGVVLYTLPSGDDGGETNIDDNGDDGGSSNGGGTETGVGSILLSTTDGSEVFLDQYKGKVVLLDMMATWCGPCRTQMIELRSLESSFTSSELAILSVGVDLSESLQLLREFKEEEDAAWPFARSSNEFNSEFPASNIPTMYILDQQGNIAFTHVGVTSADTLERDIRSLL